MLSVSTAEPYGRALRIIFDKRSKDMNRHELRNTFTPIDII
jgi:hypothetical protein